MGVLNENMHIGGQLSCETFTPPAACVVNASVSSTAAIDPDKLINRFRKTYSQPHGSAGTSVRQTIHTAKFDGTISACYASMSVAPLTTATHTVQIKKNGTDILTSAITFDNGNANFDDEAAPGYTSTSYVAGDVFEVVTTATAGGGTLGQGLSVEMQFDEETS